MEFLDMIAGTAAVIMIFAVMAGKLMTTQLLARMNRQISQTAHIRQDSLNRLKSAQSQKAVMEKNKSLLDRKKNKLAKKLARMKQELGEAEGEETARRERSQARRVT